MGQCPNCATPAKPEQEFCLVCGTDLGNAATATAGAAGAARRAAAPTPAAPAGAGRPSPSGGARRAAQSAAIPFMVAAVATILIQQGVGTVVGHTSYVYRLFRPSGGWLMSVVPGLILFSLVWTLTDLALKFRVGRATERDLRRPEILQLPGFVAHEIASVTLQRLRSWNPGLLVRPVGRRVLSLLRYLEVTDAQRAHELLRHQSDVDADAAASAYRTVKLFIWAMPILGFIGTVLGISLAVGGFSDFLTTSVSIEELDSVTAELGEVASGLSFAFDTTLLGLLAGLIATVANSAVQEREERTLTTLDELGLKILATAQPGAPTVPAAPAPSQVVSGVATEEIDQMLRARLGELSGQMQHFTQAVQTGLEGLEEATSRMRSGLTGSIASVSGSVEGLGKDLEGVSKTLDGRIAGMEQANRELSEAVATLAPLLSQLSGPMELRLTPSQRATRGGEGD
ncbi:MAG: MotA/TolQ/ExbB proton channel family protein [Gemmatimonadetes bacterium]|nr:MotA/TolQ/ExbB proton channel family protein [Gemmatimonadota bacterium]